MTTTRASRPLWTRKNTIKTWALGAAEVWCRKTQKIIAPRKATKLTRIVMIQYRGQKNDIGEPGYKAS